MESHKREIQVAYQDHSRYLLPYNYPLRTPRSQLCIQDDLILRPLLTDPPLPLECQNINDRSEFWCRPPPQQFPDGCSFLVLLGTLCINAKVRECTRKQCRQTRDQMKYTAPACGWQRFREWAIQAMSCQQSFSLEDKLSFAHTHLVNTVFGCYELAAHLHFEDSLFRWPCLGMPPEKVELGAVCNVVFWMVTIQHEIGFNMSGWDDEFLPKSLTLPRIREALLELQTLEICRNRIWNFVDLSERKQADLPDIIRSVQSHPSIRRVDHDFCT